MADEKCPRCGHSAVAIFASSGQRVGYRCDNSKCRLPVALWPEWQAMKDEIEGHRKQAEKIEKMALDHLLSNTNGRNGMIDARPIAAEAARETMP